MMKFTLITVTLATLLSGVAQAEQVDFDGLSVGASVVGQAYNDTSDHNSDDDTTQFTGYGIQFDYSMNKILGITGGYTNTSSDDWGLDLKTERFYTGANIGYRFEGEQWAVKPFGTIGFNTIEATVKDFSVNKTFNKPYLGVGVSLMYKQLFATLATDATKLDSDVVFVESRLTLGYRF
ncbi:porin family protein [Vibrio fluvialis]|nr:porin family protein [Vibrio fluvialis]